MEGVIFSLRSVLWWSVIDISMRSKDINKIVDNMILYKNVSLEFLDLNGSRIKFVISSSPRLSLIGRKVLSMC